MRWNCPHCGTHLAVSDDKLGNSWSFSRCYKCAGFALVRRSDVNLIKVDRAPAGEHVVLPEAHEEPTTMLSQNAAKNLARYLGNNSANPDKPIIKPATRRNSASANHSPASVDTSPRQKISPPPPPKIASGFPTATPLANATAGAIPPRPTTLASSAGKKDSPSFPSHLNFGLPEPLPEEPSRSPAQRLMPILIGMAGMMAISSGIYLYVQGQAMWQKSRARANEAATSPVAITADSRTESLPQTEARHREIIRAIATGSAAAANVPSIAAATPSEVIDRVQSRAMAPNRNIPVETKVITTENKSNSPLNGKMSVEILENSAHVRSGPGMEYPVVGTASSHTQYAVEDWRDRWFKIILENPAANDPAARKKTAWIRNDLVRMSR